jgi:hypothetical protein
MVRSSPMSPARRRRRDAPWPLRVRSAREPRRARATCAWRCRNRLRAASDQHDTGFLSGLGQMTKTVLFACETPAKEGFVTADEPLRQQRAATRGAGCSRGRPRHGPFPNDCKKLRVRPSAGNPSRHRRDHGIAGRLLTRGKSNARATVARPDTRHGKGQPAISYLIAAGWTKIDDPIALSCWHWALSWPYPRAG